MKFLPKQAWKAVKILVGGKESHHVKPVVMHLRLPNGNLATADAENASILAPHLEQVYTNHRPVNWPTLDDIKQRNTLEGIDHPIEWGEIKFAVRKLTNDKSPRLNDVPPDAFKALSNQNLNILLNFFNAYWHKKYIFCRMARRPGCTRPKKW